MTDYLALAKEELEKQLDEACVNRAVLIGESENINNLIKKLQKEKADRDEEIESIENFLREGFTSAGVSNLKSNLFSVTVGQPSQAVVITGKVPAEFIKIKEVEDKASIAKAIKSGANIDFAELAYGKAKLTIKELL